MRLNEKIGPWGRFFRCEKSIEDKGEETKGHTVVPNTKLPVREVDDLLEITLIVVFRRH
jgi:hypothetical protein